MTLSSRIVTVALCVAAASRLCAPAQAQITLIADTFDASANSNAVNFEYDWGRQNGILSPLTYFELGATADGGPFDDQTQIDNPSLPNSLLMISDAPSGANTAVVSPNRDFLLPSLAVQHYHVELNPAGPGNELSFDQWAGFSFGAPQGTVFASGTSATNFLIRPDGVYSVGDNNAEAASGDVTPKDPTEFYSLDFDVDLVTGDWSMSLDNTPIAAGSHGAYSSGYLNLAYYSNSASTGQQRGHFDNLEVTGQQTGPTTLFADTFDVSANSNSVNFEHDLGRQTGLHAPRTYSELDATADGGPFDNHTQVGNPSLADSLMMISDAPSGANTAVVSPNQNFLHPDFALQHYHLELNPAGPDSDPSFDVWAGFNFGSPQGTVFTEGSPATNFLIRPDGVYSVGDNDAEVSSGDVTPKDPTDFYSIDFDVDLRSGAWSLALDNVPIAAGIHGEYATGYLNLTFYSNSASEGQQLGFFENLEVTGLIPEPFALPGDYNQNGVVDAADYTIWRDSLGQVGPLSAADHTGPDEIPDGIVDQLDYELWKTHFGEPAGSGAVVPESASLGLAIVASGLALACSARSTGRIAKM